MKRIKFAALALASALTIGTAGTANAAIIIGVGFNGGAVTQVATDATTGSASYVALSNGYIFNVGGIGVPVLTQPGLLTQSLNIQQSSTTGSTLNLYITQTDLTSFNGTLLSSFTSNTLSNATAVLRSFYSTSNALFGGTQMQSAAFNSTGMFVSGTALNLLGPFSTTVRYDITFGPGTGNFNGTANLAAAGVPEPTTWAMMLLGFIGLGYAVRRTQKGVARIRFA